MKRTLALMLTVTLALAALSGCMTSQNSTGNQGEEKPSVKFSSPFDLDCRDDDGCVTTILEYESEQIVNLLNNSSWTSGGVAKVSNDYLLTFGETKIYYCSDTGTFSDIENQRWFALSHDDKGKVNNELPTTYIIPNTNKYLMDHIRIKSGASAVYPFGCLLQWRIDNGDGTFTEAMTDKYDVIDLVSGKTNFSVEDIPKLVLSDSLSYSFQDSGVVEKVYLLTPFGEGYAKVETTFDALSNLDCGIYYVVLEVLLGESSDSDFYRYEDVFGLVVVDDGSSDFISVSVGSDPVQRLLTDSDRQIVLNILSSDREWSTETLELAWNCRFSGPSVNLRYGYGGILFDVENHRYCQLTAEETESIESLISRYAENP